MATDPRVLVLEEMRKQTALLEHLGGKMAAIELVLVRILDSRADAAGASHAPSVPDRILDGPHGDPEVRQKDPRDWSGDSMKGKRFSECPPDYLDLLAERYDYFAGKEPDEKKAGYNRLDAQRARGWAARLRGGWVAPVRTVDDTQGEPRW